MKEFDQLLIILEKLLGPEGCPWDREQTLMTLRESVLEETCELIEAVDLDDNAHILEELGDLLFNVVFFCKVAEKEHRFQTEAVISHLAEKLVRRHPHVFGDVKVNGVEEVWTQWNKIKGEEKGKTQRQSAVDGIPKGLPALAYAQKFVKKVQKTAYSLQDVENVKKESFPDFKNEEELGHYLLALVRSAQGLGLSCEQALRKVLASEENAFRTWEKNKEIETEKEEIK